MSGMKGGNQTPFFKVGPARLPSVPTITQERKTDERKPLLRLVFCKQQPNQNCFPKQD
jgi:hypothetical protein